MKIQNFAGLALLMGTLMSVPAEAGHGGYGHVAGNAAPVGMVPAVPGFTAGGMQFVRHGVPAVGDVGVNGEIPIKALDPAALEAKRKSMKTAQPGCDPTQPGCN